jgi:SAM-dependent methyltransferase
MSSWLESGPRGEDYDAHFAARQRAGQNVHGEADFVMRLQPRTVLDAGCGTGRVALELARHGVEVVGVDLDPRMLDTARAKAPQLEWHLADLVDVDLGGRSFDVVVMAGNVMLFVTSGTEAAVVRNLSRHVAPGGALVAGFQLGSGMDLHTYDAHCDAAGLQLDVRFATWDEQSWRDGGDYAVSVHRRPD